MLTLVAEANEHPAGRLAQVIHREGRWFDNAGGVADIAEPRISASRWSGHAAQRSEQQCEIEADCHVIGIALQPMEDVSVFAARTLIQAGPLPAGSMRVYEPRLPMRGIFRGSYDALHLHVPNTMIAEYAVEAADARCGQWRTARHMYEHPIVDPVIERLAHALVHAEELGGAFGRSYADGISLAITARLFGGNPDDASAHRRRGSGLCKWRLKRAKDYMEANLGQSIGLADIAAATGLSRMHFAARFRDTTGLRPHEYLLRRRIERARELLANSRLALVEIAFEVGFKTQAHFTTVFARFAGETPNAWRQRNGSGSDHGIRKAA